MATRIIGVIQLFWNAYLRKNPIPMMVARAPIQFSSRPPISDSHSIFLDDGIEGAPLGSGGREYDAACDVGSAGTAVCTGRLGAADASRCDPIFRKEPESRLGGSAAGGSSGPEGMDWGAID